MIGLGGRLIDGWGWVGCGLGGPEAMALHVGWVGTPLGGDQTREIERRGGRASGVAIGAIG